MGNTILKLLVALGLDTTEYTKGLTDAEGKADKSSTNIGKSLSKIGASMMKTGGIMTAAFTVPIVAGMTKMVKSSSDLSESINAVNVVFGEGADIILKFGETSSYAVGLANSEFNQLATTTGAFLQNVGFDAAGAAEETLKLTQRAADLASVFNTDVSQALNAIQSGLKGEFNPLEQFGVKLNAAAIEAKALEMGLADATGSINDSAKATAALTLIYEQTSKVQGDFINTSTGVANSTRIAKAEMENLSASLGNELVPITTELLKQLIPILQNFNAMDPATKKTILGVLGVIAVLGPVLVALGTVTTAIGSLITFFGAGGAAATAFGAVGTFLSGTVLPALSAVIAAVGLPIIALVAAFGLLIYVIKNFGADAVNTLVMVRDIIASAIQKAIWWLQSLGGAFASIGNAIQSVMNWVLRLQEKLLGLRLPAWLTPGSPTPFETGLWGIQDALRSIASTSLPAFHAQLEFDNVPTVAASANVGADGQQSGNNYYTTVYSNSSPDEFSRSIEYTKAMAI
jgi:hypothetical protein